MTKTKNIEKKKTNISNLKKLLPLIIITSVIVVIVMCAIYFIAV